MVARPKINSISVSEGTNAWLFVANVGDVGANFFHRSKLNEVIGWRHGNDNYTRMMQPGDVALIYITDGSQKRIVGLGRVLAIRSPFILDTREYEGSDAYVQRIPILLTDKFEDKPIDTEGIEALTGFEFVKGQGSVHKVQRENLDAVLTKMSEDNLSDNAFRMDGQELVSRLDDGYEFEAFLTNQQNVIFDDYISRVGRKRMLEQREIPSSDQMDPKLAGEMIMRGLSNITKSASTPQQSNPTPQSTLQNNIRTLDADIQTTLVTDSVNGQVDALNRAPIALTLAGRLNQIWDERNSIEEDKKRFGSDKGLEWKECKWDDPFRAGFVVHVDAPWGGGKSTFVKYLSQILNPYRNSGALPDWFVELQEGGADYWKKYRRPWHIVEFNAWRHQHVNPPWWTFWQAIFKSCMESVLRETNRQAPQEKSKGPFARLLKVLGAKRTEENPDQASHKLPSPEFPYAYRVIWGRMGAWLRNWIRDGLWRLLTPNFKIGAVTTALIFALIYIAFKFEFVRIDGDALKFGNVGGTLAGILTLITVATPFVLRWSGFFTNAFQSGEAQSKDNYSMGSADPLYRFRDYFAKSLVRFRRPTLVVIDDLDRCNADYIVELIRGMQTVLLSPRVIFVLLGDRDWIEQAFATHYKDMKGIDVGAEHEFGAKFVEKAIQLSMVLPDIQIADKENYVRHILGVEQQIEADEPEVKQTLQSFKDELQTNLSTANFAVREQSNVDLIERVENSDVIPENLKRQTIQDFNRLASIRSSTDESAETATKHRLEAIANLLPANPRQIKRIINSIVLVQEIARITESVQIGTKKWQQLVRWIILSDVLPKTWYTISHNPGVMDGLYDEGDIDKKAGETSDIEKYRKKISENSLAMGLLQFKDNYGDQWDSDNSISQSDVKWLVRVMPPTSGNPLELPKEKKKTEEE